MYIYIYIRYIYVYVYITYVYLHELAHKLTKPSTRHTNELDVLYVAQVN